MPDAEPESVIGEEPITVKGVHETVPEQEAVVVGRSIESVRLADRSPPPSSGYVVVIVIDWLAGVYPSAVWKLDGLLPCQVPAKLLEAFVKEFTPEKVFASDRSVEVARLVGVPVS